MKNKLKKLEIGSGDNPLKGYLHQDVYLQKGVVLDFICNPWEIDLPYESLDEVISLATIEHLRFTEVEMTFKHIYNLLNKNGEFLFDVPDMKIWTEYLFNLTHERQHLNPFPEKHIWSTIYGWQRWPGDEHKSGWTRESILSLVNNIGFSKIEEGVHIFTLKGIIRGRFTRNGDAHLYIKATK
jgi:predicted SAM-dependent methyltransferase